MGCSLTSERWTAIDFLEAWHPIKLLSNSTERILYHSTDRTTFETMRILWLWVCPPSSVALHHLLYQFKKWTFDVTPSFVDLHHLDIRTETLTTNTTIQKLDFNDWVVFDKNYEKRMEFKKRIVQDHGVDALDCRDGGYDGCVEMLECLVEYLPRRFPTRFTLASDGNTIFSHVTKESFDL